MLDDDAKLDNDPPETLISPSTKLVAASERVKVTVVVSPVFNDDAPDVIAIIGDVVSIISALFALKEPDAPGDDKVRFALFPTASFIVPLFNESAEVDLKSRSLEVSPD